MRGYFGVTMVTVMIIVVWAIGLSWQTTFNRADAKAGAYINYKDPAFRGKAALYFFYYFGDSGYQALAYWIMSALTNDPFKLARYAGIYKAMQSAGSAGSFGMDAVATPFLNEILASWLLMVVSFPLAYFVVRTIKETNYNDEKMVYVTDIKDGELEEAHEKEEAHSMEKGDPADVTVS